MIPNKSVEMVSKVKTIENVGLGKIEKLCNALFLYQKLFLETLSNNKQLSVYQHNGFFQPVDTIREKELLEVYLKKENDIR